MAGSPGFEVVRNAVPNDLVEKGADALPKQTKHRREKYDAYEVPYECYQIRDKFISDADKSALIEFLKPKPIPSAPDYIFAGIFRETEADPSKLKTAEDREIYVTIALTNLNSSNGWYTFYAGSRKNEPMISLNPVALDLRAGDAVIWRGDLVYFHSPGGGGTFETLVYRK
ncbi:hypothetical protein TMEN_4478 [Trichophyton mentagrophytes]|nr:hypothetical protein TMEN_4478 [Trichophyton mentagrophytes]